MVYTSLGSLLGPLFYFLCYIHFSLSVLFIVYPPQLYILQGHRNGVPGGQQVPAGQRPRQVQLTALPPRRALVLPSLLAAAAATRGKTSWLARIKQEGNGPIDQRALGQ